MVASLVYLLPFLKYPALNLIDDGHLVQKVVTLQQEMSLSNWRSQLVETEIGRFRPLYYVYFLIILGGHFSATTLWWGQALTLGLMLGLSFSILLRLTRSPLYSLIGTLPILWLPAVSENFMRLGTAEVRQVVLILWFVWWLTKLNSTKKQVKGVVIGLVIAGLAFLAKETSLFLIPIYIGYLGLRAVSQTLRRHEVALGLGLFALGVLIYLCIPPSVGYATGYQWTSARWLENIFIIRASIPEMFWLLGLMMSLSGLRMLFQWQGAQALVRQNFWLIFLMGVILACLVVQLPWTYQLERYFLACYVFTMLYSGLEIWSHFQWARVYSLQFLRNKTVTVFKILIYVMVQVSLAVLVLQAFFLPNAHRLDRLVTRSLSSRDIWFTQYHYSQSLISYLRQQITPETKLYVGFNDYEVIYEIGLFASDFGRRPVTVLSENAQVATDFDAKYRAVADVYQAYLADSTSNKVMIIRGAPVASNSAALVAELWPTPPTLEKDKRLVWSIWK